MRYSRAISLAGLMTALVALAPEMGSPVAAQVMAQTADQRKVEGDRLLQQGLQQSNTKQYQTALQFFEQALSLYRQLNNRNDEAIALANLGLVYKKLAQYERAISYYQQALPIFQTLKNSSSEAAVLNNLGSVYNSRSQYEQAIGYYQQALPIYQALKDLNNEAKILNNLGSAYSSLFQYERAIAYHQQALPIYQFLKDRNGEADTLNVYLGMTYASLSQHEQAIRYYQQALPIYQAIQNRLGEALLLNNLGLSYASLSQYERAINSYQQALPIFEALERGLGKADVLSNLGVAYQYLSQYERAIGYYQQALTISQALKNRGGEAGALLNLGDAYQSLSQYERAIDYYQQALPIYQATKDRDGEAGALTNLGTAYASLSQYERGIGYYQQALPIYQAVRNRENEAKVLNTMGDAYLSLGQVQQAIGYYQQALSIFQVAKNRNREAGALSALGTAYLQLSQYERAIGYYQQALPIFQSVKNRAGEAGALTNLGIAYNYLGQVQQAIGYYEKALPILQAVKNRNSEAVALTNLGFAYDSLSRYERAIDYYQQTLPIFQVVKNRDGEAAALNNWGLALYKWGKFAEAEGRLYAGIVLRESIRADLRSDQNKVSIFEEQASSYRILQQVLIVQGKVAQALEVAERGRARAFVELLSAKQATTRQPSFVTPPTIAQIKQIAKDQNATLVQYSRINDQKQGESVYIWVVSPTGAISFRKVDLKRLTQPQNTSLAELVNQSRAVIGARGRSDIEVALSPERLKQQQEQQGQKLKQLHQLLIEPIADLLPKDPTQRVIFVPQGELFLVPFPALLDANNKPLLEKHTLLTAPSIQVLELTRRQKKGVRSQESGGGKALIVGNPIMPQVVTQVGDEPVQLSDLPGAKREALEIAKLFNTQALAGAQATETAIAQQMPNARIIHLATHGLLDDTKGLGVPGAIALAPSGNGQLNDGLLTSDEILEMKLNAELVVLSACDTGRGRITGDGVIGLSRSLITAGVPSIVVSLWKVPDDATALLMTEFYKNLKKSPDKAQALRQAMITTKQQYPDPLNWAAFTFIGEAE